MDSGQYTGLNGAIGKNVYDKHLSGKKMAPSGLKLSTAGGGVHGICERRGEKIFFVKTDGTVEDVWPA